MKLSIAMATYNGAAYLREQLESFARQTRLPDELVVSDDGSSDATLDIVGQFAAAAPFPVRVYRHAERVGFRRNFGRAIERCEGDVIFLSDQDDVWFREKLEEVSHAFADEARPVVVVHDAELADAVLRPSGLTSLGQLGAAGLPLDRFVTGCCTAFRAELKALILPIPAEEYPYDTWIHGLALALNRRRVVRTPLQVRRRHGRNTSRGRLSRLSRVTAWDLVGAAADEDSGAWCRRRLTRLALLEARLAERGPEVARRLDEEWDLPGVRARIEAERHAVTERLALLQRRRLSRAPDAIRLWRRGGYRYFCGWKSLAKDLVSRGAPGKRDRVGPERLEC